MSEEVSAVVYIVTDATKSIENISKTFAQLNFAYTDWKKALAKAKQLGYEDSFGICKGPPRPGMKYVHSCTKTVEILALEIQ